MDHVKGRQGHGCKWVDEAVCYLPSSSQRYSKLSLKQPAWIEASTRLEEPIYIYRLNAFYTFTQGGVTATLKSLPH